MIIEFELDDYYDICDEFEDKLENADYEDLNADAENTIVVSRVRIVIPELHASFRSGDWYARNKDVADSNDEDAWTCEGSVYVRYDENEKQTNEFISYVTKDLFYAAYDVCLELGMNKAEVGALKCYIDTSEFAQV